MEKFLNKYRIPSARAQWWNYANKGAYFITICTEKQEYFFGDIKKKEFLPSELGDIAANLLCKIPDQFPFTELGPTVVMPNHVHAVIVINTDSNGNDSPANISGKGGFAGIKNPMLNDNLSRVVRWYKGACSFQMRKIHADFAWQSRFHDVIIQNDEEYTTINDYINTNIVTWAKDKFFKRHGI
jgi:putative transposase